MAVLVGWEPVRQDEGRRNGPGRAAWGPGRLSSGFRDAPAVVVDEAEREEALQVDRRDAEAEAELVAFYSR